MEWNGRAKEGKGKGKGKGRGKERRGEEILSTCLKLTSKELIKEKAVNP